jgi:hypothetical protein
MFVGRAHELAALRAGASGSTLAGVTDREREVLTLFARGLAKLGARDRPS